MIKTLDTGDIFVLTSEMDNKIKQLSMKDNNMQLSSIYTGIKLYALVYHIQLGSSDVELITTRFFESPKKAWKWFDKKHELVDFVEPECVGVSGFDSLRLIRTKKEEQNDL